MDIVQPPLDEQRVIVEHIDKDRTQIDRVVSTARHAIERLKEYRSALITTAVTGKIDVRREVEIAA